MTREELEHAIRAACDVAKDDELSVLGSQAILGEFPDAPAALRQSAECDVVPRNHPERADAIDRALGELSRFHGTHGFYVHGLSLAAAKLPTGWRERTIRVQNENTRGKAGYCLEAHDLAASKLAAFRERDRAFVRVLLAEGLVSAGALAARIDTLSIPEDRRRTLVEWVEATRRGLHGGR